MGRRARHDAVVIGGGPAGAAAATTLARTGRSVALVVDRHGAQAWRVGEGAPPGLDRAVDDVFGAGAFVAADHERSYGNRFAWGSEELAATDFMLNPFGAGWHLDRVAFDARLVEVARSAAVEVVDHVPEDPAVVIDAMGRRAAYARRHGGRLVVRDRLVAMVAVHQRAAPDRDSTTTVEAVEQGWWYTAAIPGGRRVVAFLTDGDLQRSAEPRAPRHIAALVDGAPGVVQVVAAGTAHLHRPFGDGWLATGDAAACFDPLSSQGILTAVLMGRAAAEHVDDPEPYAERYRAIVEQHLAEHRATYALEQRWPAAPFWSRRH